MTHVARGTSHVARSTSHVARGGAPSFYVGAEYGRAARSCLNCDNAPFCNTNRDQLYMRCHGTSLARTPESDNGVNQEEQ
jgi:hypothetical protein